MKRREFGKSLFLGGSALTFGLTDANPGQALQPGGVDSQRHRTYSDGDTVSPDVFVTDEHDARHALIDLLKPNEQRRLNVLYIFGGGSMGHASPGGIWCPDSFEDLHIVRTLLDIHGSDPRVGFVLVACAPVFHSAYLGFEEGLFLEAPDDSPAFLQARDLFIRTTLEAVDRGIIPKKPYFDLRLRLMMDRTPGRMPVGSTIYEWQGSFRAIDEKQKYGIPTLWLLDTSGTVRAPPFRGNMYHPKVGNPYQIRYTVTEVESAISHQLERIG